MYEFINVKELKRICSNFVSVGLFHLGVFSKSCETLNCLIKNPELQFRVLSALFILNCTVLRSTLFLTKLLTNIILNYLVTLCENNEK